jgi:MOSC domain-containing protein YiiM
VNFLAIADLESGLEIIRQAPRDHGILELIVRRPEVGAREILEAGELDLNEGLVGDNWKARGSTRRVDGSANPDMQITIMNARVIALLAQQKDRWKLAGDQLFVDLDLSVENLPPGTRLSIGSAVVEVSSEPHNGCKKFSSRFGEDAVRFVNSPVGKQLHLRGINAKIIKPGSIRAGDRITKIHRS